MGFLWRAHNGIAFNNHWNGYQQMIHYDIETICNYGSCNGLWPSANHSLYPAQDQIGAGIDTGWGTPQSTSEAKLWFWSNYLNGNLGTPYNDFCGEAQSLIQEDRDYFMQKTSFNGSSGIGVGLLSARPSSGLTAGRYYWATDTNTLYRSTSSTTWETSYTPLTYPHPLRNY
jgi:hypothetical protein